MADRLGCLLFCLAVLIYSVTSDATDKGTRPSKSRDDEVEISNGEEDLELIEDNPHVLQRRFLSFLGIGGASGSNDGLRRKLSDSTSWISNPLRARVQKPSIFSNDGSNNLLRMKALRQNFDKYGIRFRFISPNVLTVVIKGNKVYVTDKLVCGDISQLTDTLSYRKTDDGVSWHTNLNLGKPMTQLEISAFEKAWGN